MDFTLFRWSLTLTSSTFWLIRTGEQVISSRTAISTPPCESWRSFLNTWKLVGKTSADDISLFSQVSVPMMMSGSELSIRTCVSFTLYTVLLSHKNQDRLVGNNFFFQFYFL